LNVSADVGRRLRRAMAAGEVRGRLVAASPEAPRELGWSARGTVTGDLVKPELLAPGLGRLTATTATQGRWDLLSGTSAAAAEVSGAAASLRARHPGWSAARVRSALATSSRALPAGVSATAGGLDATAAQSPGLVLDVAPGAWRRWAEGELADLNLPTLAF